LKKNENNIKNSDGKYDRASVSSHADVVNRPIRHSLSNEATKMETDDSRQLLAKIHALEQAFDGLLQQQKHQEKEWESRLKELESKISACSCKDIESRHIQSPDRGHNDEKDRKDPCGKDVLHLNVGGSKQIAVLRSTLTCMENSMLSTRFSGRWDDVLEKDRDGNFFIDQPADLFIPMIEFLQSSKVCVPFLSLENFGGSFDRFKTFADMVEYYGMTPVVLPPVIECFGGTSETVRIVGHHVQARDSEIFELVPRPWDTREIRSFDITLGRGSSSLRVGWGIQRSRSLTGKLLSHECGYPVGETSKSIGYDCAENAVKYRAYIHSPRPNRPTRAPYKELVGLSVATGLQVHIGDTIHCEKQGTDLVWSSNGNAFTHACDRDLSGYVPLFSGSGTWSISNIELSEELLG
jgi:BTB/POZ domain